MAREHLKHSKISKVKPSIPLIFAGLALTSSIFTANVTFGQAVVEKADIRIVDQVYQILDKDMAKVDFAKDSATLTNDLMIRLNEFVKATHDESKVDRYIVAAWADQEYPAKGELSSAQRKLAVERANRIKKALEAAGAKKVDTFEMTKQPNWIQRAFSTETAEIKGKGLSVTANEKLLKQIGQRLRDNGGPGSAVIVAKFKNEVLSH